MSGPISTSFSNKRPAFWATRVEGGEIGVEAVGRDIPQHQPRGCGRGAGRGGWRRALRCRSPWRWAPCSR